MSGGNSVVSCTWGSPWRPAVCMSNWHLECRMYICRDGYKETIVSWWFRNWSTFPYFQVCMQFPEIHYFKFPSLYLHDTLLQNWLLHSKASQNQNRSKTLRKVSTVDKTGFHHAYFIVTVWLYGYTTCIFMYHMAKNNSCITNTLPPEEIWPKCASLWFACHSKWSLTLLC